MSNGKSKIGLARIAVESFAPRITKGIIRADLATRLSKTSSRRMDPQVRADLVV